MRKYVGRFAPSPTGPLHFGSLVAAVGSYLDARAHGGQWLVRIEDLDTPRVVPGAADNILRTLAAFGLEWDGPVWQQNMRRPVYAAALDRLRKAGQVYACGCTRREASETGRYAGTCRAGVAPGRTPRTWRLRVGPEPVRFYDRRCGWQEQNVDEAVGDVVLQRADGIFAYQLAVVVDDAAQGVTDVVRGEDLLDSTARQILLQRAMGVATPQYLHLPVAVDAAGRKLSKQNHAPAVRPEAETLRAVLQFLGQPAPVAASLRELLEEAVRWWQQSETAASGPTSALARLPHNQQ